MAIQMRRGLRKDFDPNKMLPGEWAVSIDATTSNQIVWMCFAAGVCKRMGTYEDFQSMVNEISADIIAQYKAEFNIILSEVQSLSDAVKSDKESVATMHTQIRDEYLPQIANAYEYALLSKSYAVGGSGVREGEDSDNAKYYYNQTKQISQGINGIVPMGTVTFATLPTEDIVKNAMYNVSDAFTSDERFNDGGGIYYGPGNNVIWTAEGKWDVTASSNVTGIKGDAEDTYRQGNVNITAENIGLGYVKDTYGTADISDISSTVTGSLQVLKYGLDNKSYNRTVSGNNAVGFEWNDTDLEAYVDSTNLGALAFKKNLTNLCKGATLIAQGSVSFDELVNPTVSVGDISAYRFLYITSHVDARFGGATIFIPTSMAGVVSNAHGHSYSSDSVYIEYNLIFLGKNLTIRKIKSEGWNSVNYFIYGIN